MVEVITQEITQDYSVYNGDCVEVARGIPKDSIHYSIFSPPFASLYTYSNSERDMGNCKSDEEFMEHFGFLVDELMRVIMPGRLVSFHCMQLPIIKQTSGYIGLRDFRGDLIRLFQARGFIYHSEVCIWKDPLIAATRTKALGLAHKQLVKDSAMSRQGIADYLVTMRKPGTNQEPISHGAGLDEYCGELEAPHAPWDDDPSKNKYSHHVWQRYASPVWFDINQFRTLQKESARDERDERHICPLQLDVIERAITLWTNPCDIVLSPFAGIGSEGYVAVQMNRRAVLIELKASYYKQARLNLADAVKHKSRVDMVDLMSG